jgi:Na+/H+ antiporter NhaA
MYISKKFLMVAAIIVVGVTTGHPLGILASGYLAIQVWNSEHWEDE